MVAPQGVVAGAVHIGESAHLAPGAVLLSDVPGPAIAGRHAVQTIRHHVSPDVLNPTRRETCGPPR